MGVPVICFVPCCSRKTDYGHIVDRPYRWPPLELEETWAKLEVARSGMKDCVDRGSGSVPALHLYAGYFYSVPGLKETAERLIRSGLLRLFIISAGYGILDAFELARKYDAKMEGQVATYWRNQGLADTIAEVCLRLEPSRVYGFFAGTPSWSGAGAKYRYFFTAGVRKALEHGLKVKRAGCFYCAEGRGVGAILGGLGECFRDIVSAEFEKDHPGVAVTDDLNYRGIRVGYEEIGAVGISRPEDASLRLDTSLPSSVPQGAGHEAEKAFPVREFGHPPTSGDFQSALDQIFERSEGDFVEVRSGDLHRVVGGYPGSGHRMPVCCQVMRRNIRAGDVIVTEPPKGAGASLVIRYSLPR